MRKQLRVLFVTGLVLCRLGVAGSYAMSPAPGPRMLLVSEDVAPAPLVVAGTAAALPMTRAAADELADYIEKICGVRPDLITGQPDVIPARAVWIGYQPLLDTLFPDIDFDFQHPEEILIAASANHLVIAGRDRWIAEAMTRQGRNWEIQGVQREYGTINAIYTFLQDYLDVRWLMPGDIGVDVIPRTTIALPVFVHRYHPQFRLRSNLFRLSELGDSRGVSHDWTRRQRLQLDSLNMQTGGHLYSYFWDRYHESDPDMFALQPDGTRSGFPDKTKFKRCKSNPRTWETWLAYVEETMAGDPHATVFINGTNDSHNRGHCVCQNCLAWDHPAARTFRYQWEGLAQDYVALSDRIVHFCNQLGRQLRARFPERDDLYVTVCAYGNYRPAPVAAVLDDNLLVVNVACFFLAAGEFRTDQMNEYRKWGAVTDKQVWRPNASGLVGWHQGLPDVAFRQVMGDFRFVAEHNGVGLAFDTVWEDWSTLAPLYYLMAQLAWDPYQDGEAILRDYYHRAYGPAAAHMERYWSLLEAARNRHAASDSPGLANIHKTYDDAFFARADDFLARARKALAGADPVYAARVDLAGVGLEHTRLVADCARLVPIMRARGADAASADAGLQSNWEKLNRIKKDHPDAFRLHPFRLDALHPDNHRP